MSEQEKPEEALNAKRAGAVHRGYFLHVFEGEINESEGYLFPLQNENNQITIGRSLGNNLCINDRTNHLSRVAHAIISWNEQGVYIEDVNSSNGTFINEDNIRGKGKKLLEPDVAVMLGTHVCIYLRVNPASSIPLKSDQRPTVPQINLK